MRRRNREEPNQHSATAPTIMNRPELRAAVLLAASSFDIPRRRQRLTGSEHRRILRQAIQCHPNGSITNLGWEFLRRETHPFTGKNAAPKPGTVESILVSPAP